MGCKESHIKHHASDLVDSLSNDDALLSMHHSHTADSHHHYHHGEDGGMFETITFPPTPKELLDMEKDNLRMMLQQMAPSRHHIRVIDKMYKKANEREFSELTRFALHLPCAVELLPTDDAPPVVADRVKFIDTVRTFADHSKLSTIPTYRQQ